MRLLLLIGRALPEVSRSRRCRRRNPLARVSGVVDAAEAGARKVAIARLRDGRAGKNGCRNGRLGGLSVVSLRTSAVWTLWAKLNRFESYTQKLWMTQRTKAAYLPG
jgi:hypothetical protein